MGRTADNPYNRLQDKHEPGATNLNTSHYSEGREWLDQYLDRKENRDSEGRQQRMPDKEAEQHNRQKARKEQAKKEERAQEDTRKSQRQKESCVVM